MNTDNAQLITPGDWNKGRALSAKNFQEGTEAINALAKVTSRPQGVPGKKRGIGLYRVIEVVDLTANPITWTVQAVLVKDIFNTDTPKLLTAISEDLTLKLPEETFGVAVGDFLTDATGTDLPESQLVTPLSKKPLLNVATADEAAGEITGRPAKLDSTPVGEERTFKTLP